MSGKLDAPGAGRAGGPCWRGDSFSNLVTLPHARLRPVALFKAASQQPAAPPRRFWVCRTFAQGSREIQFDGARTQREEVMGASLSFHTADLPPANAPPRLLRHDVPEPSRGYSAAFQLLVKFDHSCN